MSVHYFKIAFRNFFKRKGINLLNALSLTLGIVSFIFTWQYFHFEKSFDHFHKNYENIYRVESKFYSNTSLDNTWAISPPPIGYMLKEEYPEVINYTKFGFILEGNLISNKENRIRGTNNIVFGDSTFFNFFSFPLLNGNPNTALSHPNSIVISQTLCKKLFNSNDEALGKTISVQFDAKPPYTCIISGIMADMPDNSHLKYDAIIPWMDYGVICGMWVNGWLSYCSYNYIQLAPGVNAKGFQSKIDRVAEREVGAFCKSINKKFVYYLTPIKDIHLYSNIQGDSNSGNATNVYLLFAIGLLILIISWINYINHFSSIIFERDKSIVMQKILGLSKAYIYKNVIIETLIINTAVFILALVLFYAIKPIVSCSFNINISNVGNSYTWLVLIILYVTSILISGLYFAYINNSFRPKDFVTGRRSKVMSSIVFKKVIAFVQIISSIVLIILTLVVFKQVDFLKNKSLGVDLENVLVLKSPIQVTDSVSIKKYEAFIQEVKKLSGVENACHSAYIPGRDIITSRFITSYKGEKFDDAIRYDEIDYDFLNLYKTKFIAGRNFSQDFPSDKDGMVVNRAYINHLKMENPDNAIGLQVDGVGSHKIIGVIENYNHITLRDNFSPVLYIINSNRSNYISIKTSNPANASMIEKIKGKWENFFSGNTMDFFDQKEFFYIQYNDEDKILKLFLFITIIALINACIGLFVLSFSETTLRTKEMAIRKVHGASFTIVFIESMKNLLQLVVISCIVSVIICYFVVDKFLQNYVFHISFPALIFIFSCIVMFLISVLTVSYNSYKIAKNKPIDSLEV